jgi:hypothetical protein
MSHMLPDHRRPARPDWGLKVVIVVLIGCAAGVMLSLLGVQL